MGSQRGFILTPRAKDDFKRVCERMNNNMPKGYPPSNAQGGHVVLERGVAKVILIPDIQNHFAELDAVQQRVDERSDCQAAADADRRLEHGREIAMEL
jgi:hypothetical protein